MIILNYYTTGLIHLSLEDYHNAGMTPEETKEIIEGIPDRLPGESTTGFPPGSLHCEPQYINRNWNVSTRYTHPDSISAMVEEIKWHLDRALASRKGGKR